MKKTIRIEVSIEPGEVSYKVEMVGVQDTEELRAFWKRNGGVIQKQATGLSRKDALVRCAEQFGEELDEAMQIDWSLPDQIEQLGSNENVSKTSKN